ncbi:SHOCT domain-containing protein [Candidatus Micrarchaeota archaeon]|nr:SHOCT domain-containing protein [Candidatus Micrarchaeota archaeon]
MNPLPFLVALILVFGAVSVSAHDHFAEARQLIDSGVNCDRLSDEQLEAIGDYYMEQMHPGESHKAMDETMGGEGSVSLRQMHIQMARMMYCGGSGMMGSGGTMGMMPMMNMMDGNMPSSGMMGGQTPIQTDMTQGMMGDYGTFGGWNVIGYTLWLLAITALILLVIWFYKRTLSQTAREDPLTVLKRRFAGGEITLKEFKEMKKELR